MAGSCGTLIRVMPPSTDRQRGESPDDAPGFVARYGWRVWAVPALAVVTVLVVLLISGSMTPQSEADAPPASQRSVPSMQRTPTLDEPAPTAAVTTSGQRATTSGEATTPAPAAPDPATATPVEPAPAAPEPAATTPAGVLPDGAEFVPAGTGTWHVVPGTTPVRGTGPELFTYTVEVEDGLQTVEDDLAFAAAVDAALADPRSWTGGGRFQLQRVDAGISSFRVSLTSQLTIRAPELCGWQIPLEASCYNRWADQRVMINDARWIRGAVAYGGDLPTYRVYAINHEVGHALGHRHEPCPQTGAPAPIMMQQSWGISNNDLNPLNPELIPADGQICLPNPYPFPAAAEPPG
jgi:hypothetical protein